MAAFYAFIIDVQKMILLLRFVIQVMDAVGIVPEQPEIGGGRFHAGQCTDDIIGVRDAGGVAVHRDTDHAFDGGILDGRENRFHIRTVIEGLHRNHFYAELIQGMEMPVIARHRTDEPDLIELPPRRKSGQRTEDESAGESVMQHGQAGIPARDHQLRRDAEQFPEQPADFDQSVDIRVIIAAVDPVLTEVVAGFRKREQLFRKIQLGMRWLAAGEIQGKNPRFEILKLLQLYIMFAKKLFAGEIRNFLHAASPLQQKP